MNTTEHKHILYKVLSYRAFAIHLVIVQTAVLLHLIQVVSDRCDNKLERNDIFVVDMQSNGVHIPCDLQNWIRQILLQLQWDT